MKPQAYQGICKIASIICCSIPNRKSLHAINACLNRSRLVWSFCQKLILHLGTKCSLFGTKSTQEVSNDLKPTVNLLFRCFFVKITFSVLEQTIFLQYAKIYKFQKS